MGPADAGRGSNFWPKCPKKGRGRRKGGISEAARKLPVQGKTHAAKRKNVERALKVDSIFPEAKDAIKRRELDQN